MITLIILRASVRSTRAAQRRSITTAAPAITLVVVGVHRALMPHISAYTQRWRRRLAHAHAPARRQHARATSKPIKYINHSDGDRTRRARARIFTYAARSHIVGAHARDQLDQLDQPDQPTNQPTRPADRPTGQQSSQHTREHHKSAPACVCMCEFMTYTLNVPCSCSSDGGGGSSRIASWTHSIASTRTHAHTHMHSRARI